MDYDKDAEETRIFFAKVQNKLHYAVHGQTAAELIWARADAGRDNMGLTTWAKAPNGRILKSDVVVAKNYLTEKELGSLSLIVNAYLDLALRQAQKHIPMTMAAWAKQLDRVIMASGDDLLNRASEISAEIAEAKKPLICAGGGVVSAGARKELIRLAEKLDIPVVSTLMGVGTMPSDHPLYLGMLGTHGRRAANIAVAKSDLMILCGARVGDRSLASPDQTASHARIIHIDIDTVEIGKNMAADVPIVGDVRDVLVALHDESGALRHDDWRSQFTLWREAEPDYPTPHDGYVQPGRFMRELSRMTGDRGKVILVADVGQNQMWAANSFAFDGGRFLTSGGMGTMGYSIPAAIGAKLAKPDRQVIVVCGDGSFMMMLPELSTLMQEHLPVKIIIMRNGVLGMVREIQKRRCGGRYFGVSLDGCPDTIALAGSYGISAGVLSDGSEAAMRTAIDRLLSEDGAAILECIVDPDASSLR